MRRKLYSSDRRLLASVLAASVMVFALAGSFHSHEPVERAVGGDALAASNSGTLGQATPCLACLVAHSTCVTPIVAAIAAIPQTPVEILLPVQDKPACSPELTNLASRAPPAFSTTPIHIPA